MYGFENKKTAETKAAELARRAPTEKYEVSAHRYSAANVPLTWGVIRYAPYCDAMPWRCCGFVWFCTENQEGAL